LSCRAEPRAHLLCENAIVLQVALAFQLEVLLRIAHLLLLGLVLLEQLLQLLRLLLHSQVRGASTVHVWRP
jgi:hypothetical protein